MARITSVLLIVAVLALSLAGYFTFRSVQNPTAVAMLHFIDRTRNGPEQDFMNAQRAMLTSRDVVLRAIRRENLDRLPSLQNKDAVSAIMGTLSIDQSPHSSPSVVDLTVRGM